MLAAPSARRSKSTYRMCASRERPVAVRSKAGTYILTKPIDGDGATHANGGSIGLARDSREQIARRLLAPPVDATRISPRALPEPACCGARQRSEIRDGFCGLP